MVVCGNNYRTKQPSREQIKVGDDNESAPLLWPLYNVANITLAEEIDDPNIPGKNVLLVHVFLARESEGAQSEKPPLVRELEEEEDGG